MRIEWYFDFISPYAFLQCHDLPALAGHHTVVYRPVLFAGLLKHWGQLGPAEIPPKREFTYRHCLWLARQRGVELRAPQGHPFNPLPLLRLAIAAGAGAECVRRIFDYVWCERGELTPGAGIDALAAEFGVDAALDTATPAVKQTLRDNGERAIAAGVFGVPTVVADGRVLWGQDAPAMLASIEADPALFAGIEAESAALSPLAERRR
ncbi:MAG: 2-hydroxychromene-2-carboxylate isomerase [Pseudomonadota bacterium]